MNHGHTQTTGVSKIRSDNLTGLPSFSYGVNHSNGITAAP